MLAGISERSLSALMAGVELRQFRPDEELKRLARLAVELGIAQDGAPPARGVDRRRFARWQGRPASGLTRSRQPRTPGSTSRRHRAVPHRAGLDRRPFGPVGGDRRLHRSARARRGDRASARGAAGRARPADRGDTAGCSGADRREASTRTWSWPGWSPRICRTTTSTSNIATTRCSGRGAGSPTGSSPPGARPAGRPLLPESLGGRDRLCSTRPTAGPRQPRPGRHWRSLVARRREIVEAHKAWVPEPALGTVPRALGGTLAAQFGITMENVEGLATATAMATRGRPGARRRRRRGDRRGPGARRAALRADGRGGGRRDPRLPRDGAGVGAGVRKGPRAAPTSAG